MSKKARMNRGLDALFSDNSVPEEKKEAGQAQNGTAYVSISLVEPKRFLMPRRMRYI